MKVKENVKTFVEKHKKAIVAGAISAGGVLLVGVGYKLGVKITLGEFENCTKINLGREFIYNAKEYVLKELPQDTTVTESLKELGFTNFDETVNAAIIIQKK